MTISFSIVLALVLVAPVALIMEGPMVHGLVGLITVTALGAAAGDARARPAETTHLHRLVAPFAIAAVGPALWMVIQIVPLGTIGLSHPIWGSAQSVLGDAVSGRFSIDIGHTLLALQRYLAMCAIALLVASQTIDRRRAEWVLAVLVGASTAIAFEVLLRIPPEPNAAGTSLAQSGGLGASVIGVILAVASFDRAYERWETRRSQAGAVQRLAIDSALGLIAFTTCSSALLLHGTWQYAVPVGGGLGTLASIVLTRRLGIDRWTARGMVGVIAIAAIALVEAQVGAAKTPAVLRLAAAPHVASPDLAQRMLLDTPWHGTGAGTYEALVPIYRSAGDEGNAAVPPTAAAALVIELGLPALLVVVVALGYLAVLLLRGALRRGRDSFYPAAGVSIIVAATLQAFVDPGLLGTGVLIIVAATTGLAAAQRESRSLP